MVHEFMGTHRQYTRRGRFGHVGGKHPDDNRERVHPSIRIDMK